MTSSGSLYLGRLLDPDSGERTDGRLELPAHHLTTHGVIVGMTGSGKTGLGIVLLEEVLAAGIPALILDPKGDMGNLALNFPDLRPSDFRPWVDEGEAAREGVSPEELAAGTAELWRNGLAGSGITPERMRAVRDGAEVRLITPGSSSGIGLNVLGDLRAPPASDFAEHGEALRDEIEGLVSGLLVLAGIDADPLTSPEHILLSNLVEHGWREGRNLDLGTLIGWIQTPPLRRLGVFEVDAFFPPKERMKLAMRLNGLVASPTFREWLRGEPLSVDALLRAPDGRPRASVVGLAHLSDAERQFVVTLLLSKMVTWMRGQPGTSELRALVYIDEVFGMAPPTAEPPSKRPLLTLFKQARAHGLGVVTATQNPVDLDYKIMSNAGAWMVGRLQTERDKARIIEGLRSATGDVDVSAWDARIGQLGKREFLLKTARSGHPTLFTSRWAMSYLRGPLTSVELERLTAASRSPEPSAAGPGAAVAAPAATSTSRAAGDHETAPRSAVADDETPLQPTVAAGVPVRYLAEDAPWAGDAGVGRNPRRLDAGLAATVRLLFDEARADLRHEEQWEAVLFPLGERVDPSDFVAVDHDPRDFRDEAPEGARFVLPRAPLDRVSFFRDAEKALREHLYRSRTLTVYRNRKLKVYARPGESRADFEARCLEAAEARADEQAAKLRDRYERRLQAARERIARGERRVEELQVDVGQRKQQEMIAGAGDLVSLFLGGRRRVRSLSGAASRRSMVRRTEERLRSAEEKLQRDADALQDLEEDLKEELGEIWAEWEAAARDVEEFEVPLEKSDVHVEELALFWAPAADG